MTITKPDNTVETRHYVEGIEYTGAAGSEAIESIYHEEGRMKFAAGAATYEYTLRDHLGNTRVTFTDANADGDVTVSEVTDEHHYYAFGLEMESAGYTSGSNRRTYNGKETVFELGLDWLDYGARWYDAAVARWWVIDPLAEKYAGWSGFNYVLGRPTNLIDPNGMEVDDIVFVNTNGDEIHRIVDDRNITVLIDEALSVTLNYPDHSEKITLGELFKGEKRGHVATSDLIKFGSAYDIDALSKFFKLTESWPHVPSSCYYDPKTLKPITGSPEASIALKLDENKVFSADFSTIKRSTDNSSCENQSISVGMNAHNHGGVGTEAISRECPLPMKISPFPSGADWNQPRNRWYENIYRGHYDVITHKQGVTFYRYNPHDGTQQTVAIPWSQILCK